MPMTDQEATALFEALKLSPSAIEFVSRVRSSPPSRPVGSSRDLNTPWRHPSFKMGLTLSSESTLERRFATLCEFDPDVLEYWEQPGQVQLLITDAQGKARRPTYTPDVLVIRKERIDIVQIKPARKCEERVRNQPYRWEQNGASFRDIGAEEWFSRIGLRHCVVTESDINPVQVENYELLMRAGRSERPATYQRLMSRVLTLLSDIGPQTLATLRAKLGVRDSTPFLQMIGDGVIAAAKERTRLTLLHDAWVALDDESLRAHTEAIAFMPPALAGEGIDMGTAAEVQAVYRRVQQIKGAAPVECSTRTMRRWLSRLKQGGQAALIPGHRFKGNRCSRIPENELELVRASISKHYLTSTALTVAAAFRQYLVDHEEARAAGRIDEFSAPVSQVTFRHQCGILDPEVAARARGGRRLANAMAAPVDPLHRSLSPLRPFERGQIDHYLCDLHVLVSGGEDGLTARPWLTLLRDQHSGVILAMSLGFSSPSRWACSGVLRDCVRRHQRLPEVIAVDNGAEFHSTYFEMLLAHYGIAKHSRAPSHGRGGGEIESCFKSVSEYLKSLPGGTANDVRNRGVSSSHKGQKAAKFDLLQAYNLIEDFLFGYFNAHPIGTGLRSPQELFSEGLESFDLSGVKIDFDNAFLARSALPADQKRRINPQRGIRHLDQWFFAKELLGPNHNKPVQVFVEPWDRNRIYALLDGTLVTCTHGASRRELMGSGMAYILESILHEECAEIRAELKRKRSVALGRKARAAHKSVLSMTRSSRASATPAGNLLPEPSAQPIPFETTRRDDGHQ